MNPPANSPATTVNGRPVHAGAILRPHRNDSARSGPAMSPPAVSDMASAVYTRPTSSWWTNAVARLRAAGEKPEPQAKMMIPRATIDMTGATEITSEPTAKKATEREVISRSLARESKLRLTSILWRAGSPTSSRTRFIPALSVKNTLAWSEQVSLTVSNMAHM